jgi:hypothetical protein
LLGWFLAAPHPPLIDSLHATAAPKKQAGGSHVESPPRPIGPSAFRDLTPSQRLSLFSTPSPLLHGPQFNAPDTRRPAVDHHADIPTRLMSPTHIALPQGLPTMIQGRQCGGGLTTYSLVAARFSGRESPHHLALLPCHRCVPLGSREAVRFSAISFLSVLPRLRPFPRTPSAGPGMFSGSAETLRQR